MKKQVQVFDRTARDFWGRLDPVIPAAEVEVMESPEANILGTLENLLNQDLGDVVRQLNELDGLFSDSND